MKYTILPTIFLIGAALGACKDKDAGSDGVGSCDVPGYEGCQCTPEGYCLGELKCASGFCIDPADLTTGGGSGGSGGDGDGDGDGGDGNGGNGDGMSPPDVQDCIPGSWNCECKYGDSGCAAGLDCEDGVCMQEPDVCIGQYDPCWDNDEGSLGKCCGQPETSLCVGRQSINEFACAPACEKHSDCIFDCCLDIDGHEQTYCEPTQDCSSLCIDTCGAFGVYDGTYADDGYCDDGGPNSDFEGCELGTDCADCGVRYP